MKDRYITDNLHLMRDVIDLALYDKNINMGILSLNQEKAFDRIDHKFLFSVMKALGFGDTYNSMVKLLYKDASCMIKMAGGLSVPVKEEKGIRQGCPLSGQLNVLSIEPPLCKLRRELMGLKIDPKSNVNIKVSAYADDITVIIRNDKDVQILERTLECYNKASSGKVNWEKSDTLWCGEDNKKPLLPGRLQWKSSGFKYLGVFLGREDYRRQNWEGLVEKVCARLSRWQWLLP